MKGLRSTNLHAQNTIITQNGLKILYYNARSIIPKLDELQLLCAAENPSIVCLVETWLEGDIQDTELTIPNYTIIRLDRNRHGGGVAMFIHDSLSHNVLVSGPSDLELLIVSIVLPNLRKLCLGVFYRPPSSPLSVFDTLSDTLSSLDHTSFTNFILLGDYNVNFLQPSSPFYVHLCNIMHSLSLTQVVTEPTHIGPNGQSSLIDLVFMSSPQVLTECSVIPQLANSDHLGLQVAIHGHPTIQHVLQKNQSIWRYAHADFDMACELLDELDLESIIDDSSIENSWSRWKEAFLAVMERCIPKAQVPKRKNLPWLTKDIVRLIRRRNYYYRRYQRSKCSKDKLKYQSLRNKVVNMLRDSKSKFFNNLNPKSSKSFWSAVKYLNKQESSIPTLITNECSTETDEDKADLLNTYFAECFNRSQPSLSSECYCPPDSMGCPSDLLCTEEVLELLILTPQNPMDLMVYRGEC